MSTTLWVDTAASAAKVQEMRVDAATVVIEVALYVAGMGDDDIRVCIPWRGPVKLQLSPSASQKLRNLGQLRIPNTNYVLRSKPWQETTHEAATEGSGE